MARDVPEKYGSTEVPPLTVQERAVLQATYDHFHEYGTWPTFNLADRQLLLGSADCGSGARRAGLDSPARRRSGMYGWMRPDVVLLDPGTGAAGPPRRP